MFKAKSTPINVYRQCPHKNKILFFITYTFGTNKHTHGKSKHIYNTHTHTHTHTHNNYLQQTEFTSY